MAACDIFSPPFSAIFAPVFNTSKSCLEQHFFLDILPSAQSPPHSLPSQGRKNIQYLKFARIANGGHWIVNVIVRVVVRNCQNICSLKFTFSFYVHFQKRQKIFTYYSADSPTGVESDSQADRQIFVVFASVIFFYQILSSSYCSWLWSALCSTQSKSSSLQQETSLPSTSSTKSHQNHYRTKIIATSKLLPHQNYWQ